MREICTEIVINASPERVWDELTDFSSYPEWNPFIRSIQGEPVLDEKLEVFIKAEGTKGMAVKPKVIKSVPNKEFRWLGKLGMPGLFNGEHSFKLEPIGSRKTRFTHSERFTGILVPVIEGKIHEGTENGFVEMNKALKKRSEHS